MVNRPFIASSIRSRHLRDQLEIQDDTLESTPAVRGTVLLVTCLSDHGAYNRIELNNGSEVVLSEGDQFFGVLADRFSGTSVFGQIPSGIIRRGNSLSLVAVGGLLATDIYTPPYLGGCSLPLRVDGIPWACLPTSGQPGPANIKDWPELRLRHRLDWMHSRVIVVSGTSAECGKTTTVTALVKGLTSYYDTDVSVVKACGSGRRRDCIAYLQAGALWSADFADCGLPSTYGIDDADAVSIFDTLVAEASLRAPYAIVELGGDFIEAGASAMLARASELSLPCVLCANDAAGAMEGMTQLATRFGNLLIVTLKQNAHSLALRINHSVVQVGGVLDARELSAFAIGAWRD